MNRVVFFEIHAGDPQRAMAFYQGLFGWQFQPFGTALMEYWLIATGPDTEPGLNGGLLRRAAPVAGDGVNAFVCTVEVANIDQVMAAVPAKGGQIALPKRAVPGIGWLGYVKDPEGNVFGLVQRDQAAR